MMSYSFSNCRVNIGLRELYRNGAPVAIRPQTFNVLVYLIEHHHYVVSTRELCDALWAPKVISDSTLISCIKEARRAVGDDGQTQNIIRTVHGRGYRFIASLETDSPTPAQLPDATSGANQPTDWSQANSDPASSRQLSDKRDSVSTPLTPCTSTPPEVRLGIALETSEYKPVTMLVCSLSDTQTLTAQLDPEAMHDLMQRFIGIAVKQIQRFEGMIRRALDDGIEALFGIPRVQEDHAYRAVRAALALQQHWRALSRSDAESNEQNPVAIRIGIHTGQIILGAWPGNNQPLTLTAVGDTFKLAHQLRRWAESDAILVSEETKRSLRGMVRLEAIEQQSSTPELSLTVYQVRGVHSRRSLRPILGKRQLSRFVGRESELAELEKLWTQVKQGCGQVVGITGEAGLGKTRLLHEFRRRLQREQPAYLAGRCVSYGCATPYLPILDLVRHGCGITETDTAEIITAKVHDRLQEAGVKTEESVKHLLYLLGVVGTAELLMNLSPQLLKARTFQILRQLLIGLSRQRPCVIEIEDLHWIDTTSEEFLRGLVEQLLGVPILLLVSYRPGYQPPWMDKSFATQLAMQPLHPADSLIVLQGMLNTASVSRRFMQSLLRAAQGNPFFLEELARTVVEQSGHSARLAAPDTIQVVLLGRIDRLFPETKWLLQAAAVIGKEQSLALLQAVVELPEDVLLDRLEQLQAAELLYTTPLAPEPGYAFKHVLTQEVAYQSLLQSTRQQYHQHIAEVLELRFPATVNTFPERVAQHYAAAGRNAQAAHYWLKAGQRAIDRSADAEAVALLTQGLEALTALPKGAERSQQELALRCNLGIALVRMQGYAAQDVKQNYQRAQKLCDQFKNSPSFFKVVFGLWMYYGVSGAIPTALKLTRQLVNMAREWDPAQFIYAHALMGITLFHHGKMTDALQYFDAAIAQYGRPQQHELCVQYGQDCGFACLFYSAHILWCLGYPERALCRDRKAFEFAENLEHPFSEASVFYFGAWHRVYHRDLQTVLARAEKAIHLSTEHGFPYWMAEAKAVHGWALAQNGADVEGLAELEEGVLELSATGAQLGLCYFLVLLAEAHGKAGNVDAGLSVLARAARLSSDNDEHFHDAELFRVKGELLLQQATPDRPQAEACFQEALQIARSQQAKSLELRAAIALCRLWQSGDRQQEGYQVLGETYSWFSEGFDSPDLKDAQALLESANRSG
jgi:DNA-binding winged helix-turn-helix (wHTH) protein/predicted ATPase